MAKTVIVNADGLLRMAVLPANEMLDLEHLQFVTRSENIRLATENEFKDAFPTCEVGAMPPFGNLFGVPIFCDTQLSQNEFIEFNAGTHTDSIRMAFEDFKRLAKPTMVDLVDHHPRRVA
jgi:Ala-tRNA(Pro) deacylase